MYLKYSFIVNMQCDINVHNNINTLMSSIHVIIIELFMKYPVCKYQVIDCMKS